MLKNAVASKTVFTLLQPFWIDMNVNKEQRHIIEIRRKTD